jgi:hypothetical protein
MAVGVVPRRLVRDTRARAFTIWAGLRLGLLALGAVGGAAGAAGGVPIGGALTFLWVEALAVVLVQADLRVCRETLLLANLGVSRLQLLKLTLPAVLLPEVTFQAALLLLPRA